MLPLGYISGVNELSDQNLNKAFLIFQSLPVITFPHVRCFPSLNSPTPVQLSPSSVSKRAPTNQFTSWGILTLLLTLPTQSTHCVPHSVPNTILSRDTCCRCLVLSTFLERLIGGCEVVLLLHWTMQHASVLLEHTWIKQRNAAARPKATRRNEKLCTRI
jgi:hypothetical protein